MGRYETALSIAIQLILLSTTTTWGLNCQTETSTGTFGSLSGENYIGCSKKVYQINLGQSMAVKMTWIKFEDIPGKLPYCYDGYIEVFAG